MIIELTTNSKVIPACPICHGIGQKVRKITVEHQVKEGIKVEGEEFYLCKTSQCDVAYFTQGQKTILQEQLIKNPYLHSGYNSSLNTLI